MTWQSLLISAMLASGCGAATPEPTESCDPDNDPYETTGCLCEVDSDCTCNSFTGAEFLDEAVQSSCGDDGTCVACFYD